jgi:tetratricopeptide (TPR) repeat protein
MEAAALDPTAGWALSNLCYLEFTRARHEVARGYCEEALRLSPALVAAHNNLALTYAASGDMIQAEEAFRAAGDAAAAEYNMGIMHLATGQHASAGRAFEKAIDLRPTFTAAKERAHIAKMTVVTGHQ